MRPAAGLAFKPDYFEEALEASAAGLWFEVHAENYMVEGGPRLAMLEALRREWPLSVHGVGLSLAGADTPDPAHLRRLETLVERFEPFLVSEHLAWSRYGAISFPDLLPFPRTREALAVIARNIEITQDALGRAILIENPSHYLVLDGHDWDEPAFLTELVHRTGCGLMLDVNNVYVSTNNIGIRPASYFEALPARAIGEIHLAGHSADPILGTALLIDSHDAPVAEPVWALYGDALKRFGPRPTLIERDDNLPEFAVLMAEAKRAETLLREPAHA